MIDLIDMDALMCNLEVHALKKEDGVYVEQEIQSYWLWYDQDKGKYMFKVMLDD